MPQAQKRQQSEFSDVQMLQRQVMLKELQELRWQQQNKQFGESGQHNYMNQLSLLSKSNPGVQMSPSINGTPIHGALQMPMAGNMNLLQRGSSPFVHGFPNGLISSQAQGQALCLMDVYPQQRDFLIHGSPIMSPSNDLTAYPQLQPSIDSAGTWTRRSIDSMIFPPNAGNNFTIGQGNAPSNQIYMPEGTIRTKQYLEKSMKGLDNEMLPGNILMNALQRDASVQESFVRQEQTNWDGTAAKLPKSETFNGTASLDPLEQKILFNTDDTSLCNLETGGFGSTVEGDRYTNTFPSLQSGSWSALMQSAVAEVSCSDTCQQEEWSGLSFQNPEFSTDNLPSNPVESAKQLNYWTANSLQDTSSPSSRPELPFQDFNASGVLPGFQQLSQQSSEQREIIRSDSSHGSTQQSPKIAGRWPDYSPGLTQPVEQNQLVQLSSAMQNVWPSQLYQHLAGDSSQSHVFPHNSDPHFINTAGEFNGGNYEKQDDFKKNNQIDLSSGFPVVSNALKEPQPQNSQTQWHLRDLRGNLRASENMPQTHGLESLGAVFDASTGVHGQNVNTFTSRDEPNMSGEYKAGEHFNSRNFVEPSQVLFCDAEFAQKHNKSTLQGPSYRLGLTSQSALSHPSYLKGNCNVMFSSGLSSLNNQLVIQNPTPSLISTPSFLATSTRKDFLPPGPSSCQIPSFNAHTHLRNPGFQILDNLHGHQASDVARSAGLPIQLSNFPSDVNEFYSNIGKDSSNFLSSPDSTTSGLENAVTPPEAQQGLNSQSFVHKEESTCKGSFRSSNSDQNTMLVLQNNFIDVQESFAKQSDAQFDDSGPSLSCRHEQGINQSDHNSEENPTVCSRNFSFNRQEFHHGNYSQSHQEHTQESKENHFSREFPIKCSVVDPSLSFPQVTANSNQNLLHGHLMRVRNRVDADSNTFLQHSLYPSASNGPVSFLSEAREQQPKSLSKDFLQDIRQLVASGERGIQHYSASTTGVPNQTEQSCVSLQMAPSWFKHYGSLKVRQMLAGNSVDKLHTNNSMLQSNLITASQASSTWPVTPTSTVCSKQLPSPDTVASGRDQNMAILRPNKRKREALDTLPWHREITQAPCRPYNVRMAELSWAVALNRRIEKAENEANVIEDMLPLLRAKKRLVMTNQLMQQIFRPAPASILATDIKSNYDSISYFAARLSLGDACSLICDWARGFDSSDVSNEKSHAAARSDGQDLSKTVESFNERAKMLEVELLRLDKIASFADVKLESQDLEKCSIINRFAKFHSRPYVSAVDPSSATSTLPKPAPQRYVVALTMPRVVPEGTNCLEL